MVSSDSLVQQIDRELASAIRSANPWWNGERIAGLPSMRRWAFTPLLQRLRHGLTPAVVLRGPRQVGKTTLLLQLIEYLLEEGIAPNRIFRLQFDALPQMRGFKTPILDLCRWFSESVLRKSFNQTATDGAKAFIFLDEVQNLPDWAPQLKFLVDMNPVHVLVTGSSALRIEAGRDSLAGRISTLEMGPLLLREVGLLRGYGEIEAFLPPNGLGPLKDKATWVGLRDFGRRHDTLRKQSFAAFSERGAYPKAQSEAHTPWEQVADFLNETVVQRAIVHDLRMGPRGQKRDEHLLEEVFRLACRYIGQSPRQSLFIEEIRQAMQLMSAGSAYGFI